MKRIILLTCVLVFGGCGLSDELLSFPIKTGWKSVSVDLDLLGLNVPEDTLPIVVCEETPECNQIPGLSCEPTGEAACSIECALNGTCEIYGSYSQAIPIDISEFVADQTTATVISKVELKQLEYRVTTNTFNVATPPVDIYVGPQDALSIDDDGVVFLAQVPAFGAEQDGEGTVETDPDGNDALAAFAKDYKTPFNFFADVQVIVPGDTPIPGGQLALDIQAEFKISPE